MFDILFRILEVLVGIYLIWSFTGGMFVTYKSTTFNNNNRLTWFDTLNIINTSFWFVVLVVGFLSVVIHYIVFGY